MSNQNFREWLLDSIRQDYSKWMTHKGWLEEKHHLWIDSTINAIQHIINGGTLLLATDEKRKWFESYALSKIYQAGLNRPLLPIFSLSNLMPAGFIAQKENNGNLGNMLNIAYKNYMLWYVGQLNEPLADFCTQHHFASLIWSIGESIQNSFSIQGSDSFEDYKLIEMFKLFESAIYAVIFNRVSLE